MEYILNFVYDLPVYLSFIFIVGSFVIFALLLISLLKKFIFNKGEKDDSNATNDNISYYLSTFGVFYGIMFGLHTVGVWENYEAANHLVDEEASVIVAFYKDAEVLEQNCKVNLTIHIRDYTQYVYDVAWKNQAVGKAHTNGSYYLNNFRDELMKCEPTTTKQEILFSELYAKYNEVLELRRQRLAFVDKQVPYIIWTLITIGALVTLITSSMFTFKNEKHHLLLNGLMGVTIGSFIFLVIMIDNPFKGEISISNDPYESIYHEYMEHK